MLVDYEAKPQLQEDRHPGPYKWAVVAMLWCVCFFNYADRQAIFSVFPLLKTEMNLSKVQLGVIGSAFAWVYAAFGPLAGLIGDRAKRKTLILGGLIFWSLVTLLTAFSKSYGQLVFFRAIEGFGEAFYFPAAMSIVSDYHGPATRSRAMAICQSSVYVGTIAGGTVAGFLAQYHGWRSGFWVFGSSGILLGVVLILLLREPARMNIETAPALSEPPDADEAATLAIRVDENGPRAHSIGQTLQSILTNRIALSLMAVFVCANFVAAIFLTWMPSFLHDKFDMSLSMAGLNSTVWLQMFSVLGVISGGVLADRFAKDGRGGRMLTQLIGLCVGVPFIFITGYTLRATILVCAMSGFGFFKGLYDANIWASLYDVVKPRHRAAAVGIMNSIGWLGGGFAPVIIARASESFGMSACLSATSFIYVLAAAILIVAIVSVQRTSNRAL